MLPLSGLRHFIGHSQRFWWRLRLQQRRRNNPHGNNNDTLINSGDGDHGNNAVCRADGDHNAWYTVVTVTTMTR